MKSMVQNMWSYYFYDSPQEFFGDLDLVSPPLAGVDSMDVPELISLLWQDKVPAKMRRDLSVYFGLNDNALCGDIFNAFFKLHAVEMRTIHDVVWNRKRKLTKREIRKYSGWARLNDNADETAIRQDIIKRWKNSWFAQVISKLEENGFSVGTSSFTNFDICGNAFKDETGAYTVSADWLNDNIDIRISYHTVKVLVSRGSDDNGDYYSKNGDLLTDKWDVRYAPEDFERPLMEKAGFKLADNRFEGEYWFKYDTTEPGRAVKAIKALKRVSTTIERHFKAIYESVELTDEAQEIVKEDPKRSLKLAHKALKQNPHNKTAKKLIKKLK